ncbi:phage tail protein [Paenibacillus sp. PL2-23]|uniref:phage tail protein n=1 Tax=Paenibacillus sp. PL2-23 TaxID=2100729 RepID=UPI0030FA9E85
MVVIGGQGPAPHHRLASSFHFWVELDGIYVAGFSEVSGIEAQTDVEEFREGGLNGYVHKLPKGIRYPNLQLRRGMVKSPVLWNWYASTMDGPIARKSGAIVLQQTDGKELGRWNFYNAYPVKWTGPHLQAQSNEVAVEAVEIAHTGLSWYTK